MNACPPGESNRDNDVEAELEFHFAETIEALVQRGWPEQDARAEAVRRFGNRERYQRTLEKLGRSPRRSIRRLRMWSVRRPNQRLFPLIESIEQDVRFGLRLFRKHATVTAAGVLSLSLAIGACTAAFSLIDALILRPLPVEDPGRLIYVVHRSPGDVRDSEYFNYPLFERMRDASRAKLQLFGMGYVTMWEAVFDDSDGKREKIYPQWISGDALPILGVKPALGRLLTASDDRNPGQHPVAVLSYDFWQRRFGGNPSALGRWLTLRDKQFQVVGVTEEGFAGVEPGFMTDVWVPNMMWSAESLSSPGNHWFRVWGRLQPAASAEEVRSVLQAVSTNVRREQALTRPADELRERVERFINAPVHLRSAANGPSRIRQDFERPLWVLGTIAVLVLLIACSNVASLLVARTAARDREMALRISIGAGRGRLIQQVLVESSLLSIGSCLLGALLAARAAPVIVSMLATSQTLVRLDLRIDWRVLAFVAAAGSMTTCLFGLVPALRASAVSPSDALKSGSGRHTARSTLFRPLVAAQIAFSFVVLFVAGLFLASFAKLMGTDLGFNPNNLAIINMEGIRPQQDPGKAVWRQLLERLKASPGIQSAGLSEFALFEGPQSGSDIRVPGRAVEAFQPHFLRVSPGFLETMRIRLVDGRDFEWRDASQEGPSVVIVNESFARRYFPGQPAVGKHFFSAQGVAQEIVGLAQDAKYRTVRQAAPPTIYSPREIGRYVAIQVRTQLELPALAALLREELPRVHPALRMIDLTSQSALVDNTLVKERVLALLAGFFSIVAVVLVAVGLYGVLSYSVVQRTREIGIRLALGARRRGVVGLVAADVGVVIAIGLAVGVAGGYAASRFVTALLYGVKPSDLWSIAPPLACLLVVCALSALVPALRAMRVNPVMALRNE